jgi:hypothetical protein
MTTILAQQPNSPIGAFDNAVASLQAKLCDSVATPSTIASAFVQFLELLETVPVETSAYAAARAVAILNFRVVGHELLEGRDGMEIRRAAAKDIAVHGKKVQSRSWT